MKHRQTILLAIAAATIVAGCAQTSGPEGPRSSSDATSLLVVSPNGGERFAGGDTMPVHVKADPQEGVNAVVELSLDRGATWHMLTEDGQIPLGTADTVLMLAVPDSVAVTSYDPNTAVWATTFLSAESQNCMIKVRDYDMGETVYDISDQPFTIVAR